MEKLWPHQLPVVQVRVARPTDQIEELERFYCVGVGLEKIGSFSGHRGYTGLLIGMPDASYHLEFTQHIEGSPCPAPSKDNLLVFYMPNQQAIEAIAHRLKEMGYPEVSPENPYWEERGVTIEDPDGWRIVLMNTNGI
ncbi:VOC family protein [Ureibacillus aquaedulcis]|uniref:VOC family protein n=1 Tax=Ureibacillus aquaedulcis TaxID=3058421 RepID=A0ABT8GP87_9BACL|nr:VOC family protein [Ureibacillus sp. BA0131]MDN4493217.1 VOC family protein [Ureibacillus sp. BA0131]